MSDARSSVKIPEPMRTLHPEDMRGDRCPVPREPGVYAAWITSEEALKELGVEGPAPVVAYIGKAGPTSRTKDKVRTLRDRMREHVRQPGQQDCYPFFELAELLGVRHQIIHPIWHRNREKVHVSTYRSKPSPLGQLSIDQALKWQYDNLVWGWTALPAEQVQAAESALIREYQPLLNHRGMPAGTPPPQLRRIGPYQADRVRWLRMYSYQAAVWRSILENGLDRDGPVPFFVDDLDWPIVSESQSVSEEVYTYFGRDSRDLHWWAAMHGGHQWGVDFVYAWEDTFFGAYGFSDEDAATGEAIRVGDEIPGDMDAWRFAHTEELMWIAASQGERGPHDVFSRGALESGEEAFPDPEVVRGLLDLIYNVLSRERH